MALQQFARQRSLAAHLRTIHHISSPSFRFLIHRRSLLPSTRHYASTTTNPPSPPPPPPKSSTARKSITLASSPHKPWTSLSTGQKAARTTEQTFNLGVILLGLGLTVGVTWILWAEVFSGASKTSIFNQAVSRIRDDPRCVEILVGDGRVAPGTEGGGDDDDMAQSAARRWTDYFPAWLSGGSGRGARISAYGEGSWSRWARNRTIASSTEVDRYGVEHMRMHFYVAGPKTEGTVEVHMRRRKAGSGDWEWWKLALDVPGRERVWLEDAERQEGMGGVKGGRMFGVKWF